jgi:hypothetical protein
MRGFCEMSLQKKPKSPKLPKCKICKKGFVRQRAMQQVCSYSDSPNCSIEHAKQKSIKDGIKEARKARVEHRKAKVKAKTRGQYAKEAQIAINAYRRELTRPQGCISCGTHNGKMNGGHYRSVGASPATRYMEINIWCQCERCNSYLSGNLIGYRIGLIKRIGLEAVEKLESDHEPAKHTITELIEIRDHYRLKLRELLKNTPTAQ